MFQTVALLIGGLALTSGAERAIELTNVDAPSVGYVRVADAPGLEPQEFTLEAWITPTGPGFGNTSNGAVIVAKSVEGATGNWLLPYGLEWRAGDHRVAGYVAHDVEVSGAVALSARPVEIGETVHVALTFDGATLRLYLDCAPEAAIETPASNIDYGDEDLLIGAANFGAGFLRRFQGEIDDVRLWDHARAPGTIAAELGCTLNGDEEGLLAYYTFNADDARDDSAHGHDGTLVGTVGVIDGTAVECLPPCPWDLDCNDDVGFDDLLAVLGAWGTEPGGPPDFDGGGVGFSDLLEILGHWGPCP
jgi:hypothetical protein